MIEEQKDKVISAVTTVLLMAVAVVICAFVGFKYPNPPIPEEGVEVNLGNSETGLGAAEQPNESHNRVPPAPTGSVGERIAHQNTEATDRVDAANHSRQSTNNNIQSNQEQPKQPSINQNALFKRSNKSQGGSEGVTQGTGNQGKAGGNPNSTRYDGTPGNGGRGWSLEGRGLVGSKPQISYESNEQGKNVVKIWVDRSGKVVRAEANQRGSTITKPYFADKAKDAALQFHFTAKPDAEEPQIGYVTVVFSNVD
jgi:outer membrane biosynthesis protein TonB